jgi:hypothetical protein
MTSNAGQPGLSPYLGLNRCCLLVLTRQALVGEFPVQITLLANTNRASALLIASVRAVQMNVLCRSPKLCAAPETRQAAALKPYSSWECRTQR